MPSISLLPSFLGPVRLLEPWLILVCASDAMNDASEMPRWMPDISTVDIIRERLLLKARKSPSIHFFNSDISPGLELTQIFSAENEMSPLSEHPLTLSVNCSSPFQHPWLNLCFNYFFLFIAGFQFMIPRKPDSIESALPYTASRSGINPNATSHIVVRYACPDIN